MTIPEIEKALAELSQIISKNETHLSALAYNVEQLREQLGVQQQEREPKR